MARVKKVSAADPAHMPHSDQFHLNRPSLWEAMLSMLAVGVLHAFLPTKLLIGPAWLLLAIEAVFLLPIVFTLLTERGLPYKTLHPLLLTLLGVLTLGLASGIMLLIITVVGNKYATVLLRSAILLWCSNVLIFGLWYWQIDGGGPMKRHQSGSRAADFLFPQQEDGNPTGWIPGFIDYLFLAFTGATARSPTEMFPLTGRAKVLMMIEAFLSVLVVAVPAISEFHLPW
ncbi:hypothetical protein [Ktedonobacter racemifer]|uniref:DUF1345 domain-containing protein n=1 Tax=Ktedonobacter racemifer DSM 44963 TaxID=485913 RepID=D6TWE5_KTERA|nr:hypothetical protein [Ktedonobacter racemifer]EFH84528.1 conserved hypothetical protein [Ktedonobacter racemifer DSM 44963]